MGVGLKLSGVSSKTSIPMVQLTYLSPMDNSVVKGREGGAEGSAVAGAGAHYPGQAPLVATAPLLSGEHIQTGGQHGKDGNPLSPHTSESPGWGHEPHGTRVTAAALGKYLAHLPLALRWGLLENTAISEVSEGNLGVICSLAEHRSSVHYLLSPPWRRPTTLRSCLAIQ